MGGHVFQRPGECAGPEEIGFMRQMIQGFVISDFSLRFC